MSLKPADTDVSPAHRHPLIPCKQEIVSVLPYTDDEGSSVYVSEELGSSSGSNDGTIAAQHDLGIAVTSTKRVFVTNHPLSNQTQSEIKEDIIKGFATPNAKMTKKPVKPLACPRCNSWDTKFCYYNNYNVNQPRHFCKNCQRYWTAGGTLRNVPVGAGCRKHKNSATQQKQCTSEALSERSAACQPVYEKTSASKTPRRSNEITTGHSSHLRPCLVPLAGDPLGSLDNQSSSRMLNACHDMAATSSNVLGATAFSNYGLSKQIGPPINMEQKTADASHNVLVGHRPPLCNDIINQSNVKHEIDTLRDEQPTDESASASCVTSQPVEIETCEGNLKLESPAIEVNAQGEVTTDLCGKAYIEIHGSWHYGVNSTCNEPFPAAPVGVSFAPVMPQPNPLAWNGASGNVWASLPWPIMQSAMCIPQSDWARPLGMPWGPGSTPAGVTPSTSVPLTSTVIQTAPDSEMGKTARKHRLDSSPPEAGEGCLWVPKTLRIDDPVEAARSSIWETLGIGDGPSSLMICNATKALQFNSMEATDEKQLRQQSKNHAATRSPNFGATDEQKLHQQTMNPAATRSLNFAATDEKQLHQQSMNPAVTRSPNVGHSS